MAKGKANVSPPELERPNEDIIGALYPVGQAILESIKQLESSDSAYPGWIFFLQRFYSTMHYAMTGEIL